MIRINYPPYQPAIKKTGTTETIFDEWRKKWVVLTPEEWVRQNFLQYLIHTCKYPASLIAVEKEIRLGDLKKRFDIVVYDRAGVPWMVVECKEMNVQLDASVLDQALRYNLSLKLEYIVITNGSHCYAFSGQQGQLTELTELPVFS